MRAKAIELWRLQSVHQWRRWDFWASMLAQWVPVYALILEIYWAIDHADRCLTIRQLAIGLLVVGGTFAVAFAGAGWRISFVEKHCT